jgi:putative transposase
MKNSNDFRTGSHCVFKLNVYLVFVTKYRRHVFTDASHETLRAIFAKVCQDSEAMLVDANAEKRLTVTNSAGTRRAPLPH